MNWKNIGLSFLASLCAGLLVLGVSRVLDYESGLLINGHTLYVIGDYKRRHPGDASYLEWEQRGYNIVRSFNGSLASGWPDCQVRRTVVAVLGRARMLRPRARQLVSRGSSRVSGR